MNAIGEVINVFTWLLVLANIQLTTVQCALYHQWHAEQAAAFGSPAVVIQLHLHKMRKVRRWCWPLGKILPYARRRLYQDF
jgi:hypothetical protein